VALCLRWQIHSDVISCLSVLAAAMAAVCFWRARNCSWFLLVGPMFCYLRLWYSRLDGMVARASGKVSPRGEILNDFPERISDVLIFVGVAHSGLNAVVSGYWAAMLALMTAYAGLFGQAVGVERDFTGFMAKPWRMVALHAGAWLTLAMIWCNHGDVHWGRLTVLDWTCWIIVAGCVQTIWVRLNRIMEKLQNKNAKPGPP
jgi:phosphatidylglycerophosphate synthase